MIASEYSHLPRLTTEGQPNLAAAKLRQRKPAILIKPTYTIRPKGTWSGLCSSELARTYTQIGLVTFEPAITTKFVPAPDRHLLKFTTWPGDDDDDDDDDGSAGDGGSGGGPVD